MSGKNMYYFIVFPTMVCYKHYWLLKFVMMYNCRCHALVLVFCDFFIILVRPGCDMGLICGVFCLGVFVRYWDCGIVGLSSIVYGCLEWFSIRGRCLSLSLIGNHI